MGKLFQDSGGTTDDRVNEAKRILFDMGLHQKLAEMEENESRFVGDMYDRIKQFGSSTFVSPKALFWLRDLKDKYVT